MGGSIPIADAIQRDQPLLPGESFRGDVSMTETVPCSTDQPSLELHSLIIRDRKLIELSRTKPAWRCSLYKQVDWF